MSDPHQILSVEPPDTPSGTAEDATALQPKTEKSSPDTAVQEDAAVETTDTKRPLTFAEKWGKYVSGGKVPPPPATSSEVAMKALEEMEEERLKEEEEAELGEAEREATMEASTQKSSEAATEAKEEGFDRENATRKGSYETDGQQN